MGAFGPEDFIGLGFGVQGSEFREGGRGTALWAPFARRTSSHSSQPGAGFAVQGLEVVVQDLELKGRSWNHELRVEGSPS